MWLQADITPTELAQDKMRLRDPVREEVGSSRDEDRPRLLWSSASRSNQEFMILNAV